jgi:serine/threonine protein kinase
MHTQIFDTYNQYTAHKSLCEDYRILHRDISFSNLLLTRPSSTEPAVGLLIDFDYAQHMNEDASEEMVVTAGDSSPNTRASAESSCVLIPSPIIASPIIATSAENPRGLISSLSSSTSAAGGVQAISMPDKIHATGQASNSDIGRGMVRNPRTVSLIFFR